MSIIDRQRVEAVRLLTAQGFAFTDGGWQPPAGAVEETLSGDLILGMMMNRAEKLTRCTEGSTEESELEALNLAIDAYQSIRWPGGKIVGGKG